MGNNGTDEKTDSQTNRNSDELLRHAESLAVRLVHAVCTGSSGEADILAHATD